MGYILHSYKLDSKKKPYLDHYCYVGSVNQEVNIILPGYGEGLHTIQVDDITDEGIYFHYIVGKFGKGFLPRKEAKNVQAGSEHWDYVQGTVRSVAQYQIKLYTVDEFFKNVLKHRYPDKEWITKQVLDQIPNPQDYLKYALDYWSQCGWWVYLIMYENYKYGKYGLPKGVDHYLEFIIRDLNPQDKKPFLESYRSLMIEEFADIFEPYEKDKNYCSEVSGVDHFSKNFLLKYRLADIELRNDEEALRKVMSLIHPHDNKVEFDEYYACMVVVKYYLEGRFSKLISRDKALECAGIYLAGKNHDSSYLFDTDIHTYYDYEDREERDEIWYYYKESLAKFYLNKMVEKGNALAKKVLNR